MEDTRTSKTNHLAAEKMGRIIANGCARCGKGKLPEGFERYWCEDLSKYNPRRFVFKYTEPRGSDVPVAKLPRIKNTTIKDIDHALSRCVILCRTCSDPRRTKKENDQCNPTTATSPSDS